MELSLEKLLISFCSYLAWRWSGVCVGWELIRQGVIRLSCRAGGGPYHTIPYHTITYHGAGGRPGKNLITPQTGGGGWAASGWETKQDMHA